MHVEPPVAGFLSFQAVLILLLMSAQRKVSNLSVPLEQKEGAGEAEAGGGHLGRPHQELRPAAV